MTENIEINSHLVLPLQPLYPEIPCSYIQHTGFTIYLILKLGAASTINTPTGFMIHLLCLQQGLPIADWPLQPQRRRCSSATIVD